MQKASRDFLTNRIYIFLLTTVFFMHAASYLVIPIFPVFLEKVHSFSVGSIGFVLGIGNIAYQIGSLISGLLSDRMGRRNVIIVGSFIQAAAMFGYSSSYSFTAFFAFAIVNGIGFGLVAPAIKAKIADSIPPEVRTTAFSWRGIAAHSGIILAGLAVTFLSLSADKRVFVYASVVFLIMAIFTFWRIPSDRCEGKNCQTVSFADYKLIGGHRSFLFFSAVSLLIWALYAQLALALPLRGGYVLGNSSSIGLLWTINSLSVVLLQGSISRFILNKWNPYLSMLTGTVLLGVGLVSLGWAYNFVTLSASALIFILGEMLFMPVIDSLVGHFAKQELLGTYYGISNVVAGIGGAIGTTVGGTLLESLGGVGSITPWITYGIIDAVFAGLLGLFAYYSMPRHRSGQQSLSIKIPQKEKNK